MDWFTVTLYILLGAAGLAALAFIGFLTYVLCTYLGVVVRIFEEKPLFIIPRGQPVPGSEEVRFPTADGLTLAGSYLRTPQPTRRGVVLFGPEFGSNRWSCSTYCAGLLQNGFDVFTFEFRNQGESDSQPGYEPLQWVTAGEVADVQAALAYLKRRPDADPRGVGVFGVSRGGGAALCAAAADPWVRCVVTDGAFATVTTMVPYMRKWVAIYSDFLRLQRWLPEWIYILIARLALRHLGRRRRCRFPSMERAIARIAPRPLLMIHGGADTYIKPEIARKLFARAREPKEFWLVEGAKHNQALHVANGAYQARVLEFFTRHLAGPTLPEPAGQQLVATA